ncbi:protein distal antenna [Venturia canescens]|uniref:protein distal antenna n=1 Tax=Venturia canescens TaxID=32260 RepID=UPI001C9CD092|nr:protein distal antenna [Venturia canescens]
MRGESARPGKRPLRALSASEKMEAIQRVHEGESKASVARDIGVPESTLRGWCKSEHKIRGMARNSSTPDSEVHSPASSSGTNLAATAMAASTTHSSEDEAGPAAKRAKIDQSMGANMPPSSYGINENSENDSRLDASSKIDYMSLMTSMATMRPENSALLLQQLGLLSGAGGASNIAKSLLSLQTGLPHSSTVGLVENGLQYTKASNKLSRHSISAIAPTQIDSVTKTGARKSLPAAAEAPATPVPASPRKTNENMVGAPRIDAKNNKKDNGNPHGMKKPDESLWNWLTQQQQLMGQQSASFNPSVGPHDGSWFWQYYKQCGFSLTSPTSIAATPVAKKSPSKTRALLDNVLCNNNNNENVKRSLNMDEIEADSHRDDEQSLSTEEAIEHGEKFFKWLDRCSDPAVTRLQIMQFKYLLDNLKSCRKKTSSAPLSHKQSRK